MKQRVVRQCANCTDISGALGLCRSCRRAVLWTMVPAGAVGWLLEQLDVETLRGLGHGVELVARLLLEALW